MLTVHKAYLLFCYTDWAMLLVGLAALALSLWWSLCAALPKNRGRRKRMLLRALISIFVAAMYYGIQWSVMVTHVYQEWTPLLTVRFVLPVIVMSVGLIASIVCALCAVLRWTGTQRRQIAMNSLLGCILCAIGLGPHVTTMLIPFFARVEHANRPGTLTKVGQPAPDFEITSLEGTPFRTVDLRGSVKVLCFFATWCGPCMMELPSLQAIWDEFRDNDDLRMLAIGREESEERLEAFRQEQGFTLPMACDRDGAVFHKYASKGIPRTYLVSRQGTIIYQCTGYYEEEIARLRKLLRKELAKEP